MAGSDLGKKMVPGLWFHAAPTRILRLGSHSLDLPRTRKLVSKQWMAPLVDCFLCDICQAEVLNNSKCAALLQLTELMISDVWKDGCDWYLCWRMPSEIPRKFLGEF